MTFNASSIVKRIIAGACALTVAVGLAACGSANASIAGASDDVLARIEKTGELNIGVSGAWPPYQFVNDKGELEGVEISITKAIAKDLGVKAVFHKAPWDSLIAGLESDRYDIVVHNLVVTPERAKKFDYSTPYANDPGKVAVLESVPGTTIDDVKGKNITVGITSNYATALQAKGANVVDTKTDQAELVKAGRADGLAGALTVIQSISEANPDLKLKVLKGNLNDNESVVFFKKNQPDLKKKIDATIKKGLSDGSFKTVFEKYTSNDLTPGVKETSEDSSSK